MHILSDSQRTRNGTSYEIPSNETTLVILAVGFQGLSHWIFLYILKNKEMKNSNNKLVKKWILEKFEFSKNIRQLGIILIAENLVLDLVGRSVMWSDPDLLFTCNKKDQMA